MSKTPPEVPRLLISIQPPTIQPPVSKRGPREGSFPRNNRVNLTSNRVVVEKETTGERTDVRTIVHNCVDQTHCDRRPRLLYDRSDQNQQLENRCEATFSAPTLLQPLGIWLTCRIEDDQPDWFCSDQDQNLQNKKDICSMFANHPRILSLIWMSNILMKLIRLMH